MIAGWFVALQICFGGMCIIEYTDTVRTPVVCELVLGVSVRQAIYEYQDKDLQTIRAKCVPTNGL